MKHYHSENSTTCPHCGAKCRTCKTKQITNVYREVTYSCTNISCGCVFVAGIEPIRLLSLPAVPNPEIAIPLSTHISRAKIENMLREAS